MHVARHRTAMALAASLSLAAGLAPGCGDDDDGKGGPDDAGGGSPDGSAGGGDAGAPDAGSGATCTPQRGTNLSLQLVARGFDQPVFVTSPPGDPRLFVVSKHGVISIVKDGKVLRDPFLDIDDRVASAPGDNERGLLGLAFHPDYARNGRFFVFYTREAENPPDRLAEFHVTGGNPDIADPESEREIVEVPDLESNHNGGMLAFGKDDGYLYAGLGDGGGANDQHGDIGNGQDQSTLLGDILRIDVDATDKPYAIPPTNPYAGSGGNPLEEIFISGVRNPWRWSFDRETGDLYIGDVGQGQWEEVDVLPAGKQAGLNLGWNRMEGSHCFPPDPDDACDRTGLTLPVAEYANPGDGAAVIGGYVYRGACNPDIRGWYFYGDYNKEHIFKFIYAGGQATEQADVTDDIDPKSAIDGLSSFGEDAAGEVYVVSLNSGEIYRIVAGP